MVEELTAQFRVCKHIKRDGNRCNSPAMTGMNFCFHHIGGKVASLVREGSTWDASAQLDFPYPADREAIQQSLHLVVQALREGKIDAHTANTYTRIFRLEEQNLHRWEKKQKETGKTKMQPANSADATDPGGPIKPAVGLNGVHTTTSSTPTDVIPTDASKASGAEEPALPPSALPTQPNKEPSVSSVSSVVNSSHPLKPAVGLSGAPTNRQACKIRSATEAF